VKGRRLRLLIALGAGAVLVGLAALLVGVSALTDFYAACFWFGVVCLVLAGGAQFRLSESPSVHHRARGGRPGPTTSPAP